MATSGLTMGVVRDVYVAPVTEGCEDETGKRSAWASVVDPCASLNQLTFERKV